MIFGFYNNLELLTRKMALYIRNRLRGILGTLREEEFRNMYATAETPERLHELCRNELWTWRITLQDDLSVQDIFTSKIEQKKANDKARRERVKTLTSKSI